VVADAVEAALVVASVDMAEVDKADVAAPLVDAEFAAEVALVEDAALVVARLEEERVATTEVKLLSNADSVVAAVLEVAEVDAAAAAEVAEVEVAAVVEVAEVDAAAVAEVTEVDVAAVVEVAEVDAAAVEEPKAEVEMLEEVMGANAQ